MPPRSRMPYALNRAHGGARLLVYTLLLMLLPGAAHAKATASDVPLFDRIIERARRLSTQDWKPAPIDVPEPLRQLTYDQYRDIRFRKRSALWRGETRFEVELFHPGFLYRRTVDVHVVEDGRVVTLPFDADMFRYGERLERPAPDVLARIRGFAGVRLHYPINTPDYKDEVAAFLGASYFRLVGRGQTYGLSTRGLAVDTGLPQGEEFPRFSEFWLVKPDANARSMTLFALLESKSVTGAYRFRITPGHRTRVDMVCHLFARSDVKRLGIAPMTSMFLYGENSVHSYDDARPEVHDSDSLLVEGYGPTWTRRPLVNRERLRISSFTLPPSAGFGLFQSDRDFDHYRDLETHYQARPSLWAEPREPWGKGSVYLIEIPSTQETHDNIVAFWTPADPMKAGEHRRYAYRLETLHRPARLDRYARVLSTRTGWAAVAGSKVPPPRTHRRFVVTFGGGPLASVDADQPVQAKLTTSAGSISEVAVSKLPDGSRWQVAFRLDGPSEEPADMRLTLMLGGERLSETWNDVWYPDAVQ